MTATEQSPDIPVIDKPVFKDRSTGLSVYGVLQIAMGCFAALMVPLMLLSLAVNPAASGGTSAAQMIPAAGLYAIIAIALVCLGIGSIRARRWARALTLVLAWMWLVMGVMTLITMIVWMPNMSDMLAAQGQQMPAAAMSFMYVVMFGTMGCMYVVLPGIFIAFYGRDDVKATCEAKDRNVRWTDHCPLPVLSLSLLLAIATTSVIWSASYGFVTPLFGIILKDVPGAIFFLGISLLFGYLAWATYKQRMAAWWVTLVAWVAFGLSTIVSFSRISLMDLYREMNFPDEQLKIMEDSGILEANIPLVTAVYLVVFLGYLLWVRGYMVAGSTEHQDS